jgi:TldD protein
MSYLDTANDILLSPTGLEVNDLQNVLDQMMGNSINRADLYFQTTRHEVHR